VQQIVISTMFLWIVFVCLAKVSLQVLWSTVGFFFPPKPKNLRGELALITGAASGIGKLLAIELAKEKCNIILVDIDKIKLEQVATEVRYHSVLAWTYPCDVSKRESIYQVAEKIKKEAGNVSILVNNATVISTKNMLEASDESITKTFQVNSLAHFWTVKAFLPNMLDLNHGHIVTIASNAGLIGFAGMEDFSASKFAAIGFDESLRHDLKKMGKLGVKTTCVCPYFVNIGQFQGAKPKPSTIPSILNPDYVVSKIMHAIKINQKVLVLPRVSNIVSLARAVLPTEAFDDLSMCFEIREPTYESRKSRTHSDVS